MSIHRAKYLIAAAALSIATLLPGGTTAAAVSRETCTGHWALTPSSPPPAVLGQSVERAAESLRAYGYDCKVVNDKPITVAERAVVVAAQNTRTENDPDGGISLVHLSLGVVMPDLVGKTLRVAGEAVTQLGLAVRTSPSDGAADWTVRQQRPGAGNYAVFDRAVTLILEKPVQPGLVPVPDLIGSSEDEARGAVESGRPSWLVPLLLGTAVLAVGAAGRFRHRRHPKPRVSPVPQVHAVGRLTPGIPQIKESGPTHRIRVDARLDRGHHYLQEKDDEHQ